MRNPKPTIHAQPPLGPRLLKAIVAAALGLALTFIAGLALLGFLTAKGAQFETAGDTSRLLFRTGVSLLLLFLVLLPLGLGFAAIRQRWLTGAKLAAGWLAVLPVLIWLAWDEPTLRQPPTVEDFTLSAPDAERSYGLLMRYSARHPTDDAREFDRQELTALWRTGYSMHDSAQWLEFVRANRAGIESDWATLSPQRRWLDALNAFDRIADLTPGTDPTDVPKFRVWQALARGAAAIATLRALDGDGDEAVAVLLPALETSRKLQDGSRTVSRATIGFTVEHTCLQAALIVLEQSKVATASHHRLSAALGTGSARAAARRLILAEYTQFLPPASGMNSNPTPTIASPAVPGKTDAFGFLSPLVFNPVATANRFGEHLFELAALAEARSLPEFSLCHQRFVESLAHEGGMKNVGGRLQLIGSDPPHEPLIQSYWTTVDLRDAVRQRLARADAPD